MTNEEKILEMLYELQKGQEELKADIADLKEKQEDIQIYPDKIQSPNLPDK